MTILSWFVKGQTACSLHLLWVLRGRDIKALTLALWNWLICVSKRLRNFCISRCVGLAMEWLINHLIVATFNSKLELRWLIRTQKCRIRSFLFLLVCKSIFYFWSLLFWLDFAWISIWYLCWLMCQFFLDIALYWWVLTMNWPMDLLILRFNWFRYSKCDSLTLRELLLLLVCARVESCSTLFLWTMATIF